MTDEQTSFDFDHEAQLIFDYESGYCEVNYDSSTIDSEVGISSAETGRCGSESCD